MTYAFHKRISKVSLPNGATTHWAYLVIRKGSKDVYWRKYIPCRSRLYKLINHFYFRGNFSQEEVYASITEEDKAIIEKAFENRKNYSLWKKIYDILSEKGTEEALKAFQEKAKLFGLISVIKEGKESL